MSAAFDIKDSVSQALGVKTSTGDKYFGGSGGNPNLLKSQSVSLIAVVAFLLSLLFLVWLLRG